MLHIQADLLGIFDLITDLLSIEETERNNDSAVKVHCFDDMHRELKLTSSSVNIRCPSLVLNWAFMFSKLFFRRIQQRIQSSNVTALTSWVTKRWTTTVNTRPERWKPDQVINPNTQCQNLAFKMSNGTLLSTLKHLHSRFFILQRCDGLDKSCTLSLVCAKQSILVSTWLSRSSCQYYWLDQTHLDKRMLKNDAKGIYFEAFALRPDLWADECKDQYL